MKKLPHYHPFRIANPDKYQIPEFQKYLAVMEKIEKNFQSLENRIEKLNRQVEIFLLEHSY